MQLEGSQNGAPRWTYILAAIAGAMGTTWAMLSHFVPTAATRAAVGAQHVSVFGHNNVGIETTNSGEMIVEQPPS